MDFEHSECCDFERTYLAKHCKRFQYSFRNWTAFLHSEERMQAYWKDDRHRSDLAGDELLEHLLAQERTKREEVLLPLALGRQGWPLSRDRSEVGHSKKREYVVTLKNDSANCFQLGKARKLLCHAQEQGLLIPLNMNCLTATVILFLHKCLEIKEKTLDVSVSLAKVDEKKNNFDLIGKIPSIQDIDKGAKQSEVGISRGGLGPATNTIHFEPSVSIYDQPKTTEASQITTSKPDRPLTNQKKKGKPDKKSESKMQDVIGVTLETTTLFEEVPLPFPTTTTTHKPKVTSKFKKTTTTVSPYLDPPKKKDERVLTIDFPDSGRPLLSHSKTPVPPSTPKPPVKTPSTHKTHTKDTNSTQQEKEKAFHYPSPTNQSTTVSSEKKKKTLHFYNIDL